MLIVDTDGNIILDANGVDYDNVTGTKPPANADSTSGALEAAVTITAGGIILNTDAVIKSYGKDSYNDTTAGFYLGMVGGSARFGIGNNTNYIQWNGSTLAVRGSLNADDITAGTLTGRNISGGTITGATLRTSASGQRFEVSTSDEAVFYDTNGVTKLITLGLSSIEGDTILGNFGNSSSSKVAVRAESSSKAGLIAKSNSGHAISAISNSIAQAIGVSNYGTGRGIYSFSTSNYGVDGYSENATGVAGAGVTYDFYARRSGNYGPFTGAHDALVSKTEELIIGDILVDKNLLYSQHVSNTIFECGKNNTIKDPAVVGVYVGKIPYNIDRITDIDTSTFSGFMEALALLNLPAAIYETIYAKVSASNFETIKNKLTQLVSNYNWVNMNAVGEGQINVCKDGGDITVGDYICSSSRPGKGMKQDDDLLHNYTVAKAREAVTWTEGDDDIKMIACSYHCG
jgi:hypothetical protein